MRTSALARTATTGIYLVRGISRHLQRAARARAVSEGTTLRTVLLKALAEYAAGSWKPQRDGKFPGRVEPSGRDIGSIIGG